MKKNIKIAVIIIVAIVILSVGTFLIYASDYYRADDTAIAAMQIDSVTKLDDRLIIVTPDTPGKTAMIFYPGAKVEYFAYLPLMEKIKDSSGIMCILVKMPFNMAIFDPNAAEEIMEQFPEIENWYVAGHSMGGAMASYYASNNQDKVKGLILLGAYIYGDFPENKALTIYGSFNTSIAEKINYAENIVVIEGGNHAQFGNYGKQNGDVDAAISSEEQQSIAAEAIKNFIMK
ncbi:MAG TPA: alpha/beta fold hydrolase [Gudongella oleilytica]|nr:alpha/beta fold hydrolase [Gudongella oleilytica]